MSLNMASSAWRWRSSVPSSVANAQAMLMRDCGAAGAGRQGELGPCGPGPIHPIPATTSAALCTQLIATAPPPRAPHLAREDVLCAAQVGEHAGGVHEAVQLPHQAAREHARHPGRGCVHEARDALGVQVRLAQRAALLSEASKKRSIKSRVDTLLNQVGRAWRAWRAWVIGSLA